VRQGLIQVENDSPLPLKGLLVRQEDLPLLDFFFFYLVYLLQEAYALEYVNCELSEKRSLKLILVDLLVFFKFCVPFVRVILFVDLVWSFLLVVNEDSVWGWRLECCNEILDSRLFFVLLILVLLCNPNDGLLLALFWRIWLLKVKTKILLVNMLSSSLTSKMQN
jgi:hypothetical protein